MIRLRNDGTRTGLPASFRALLRRARLRFLLRLITGMLTAAAASFLLLQLGFRLLSEEAPLPLTLWVAAGAALLCGLAGLCLGWPTALRTAVALDRQYDLKERLLTLFTVKTGDAAMLELQRQDAEAALLPLLRRKEALRPSRRALLLLLCLLLSAGAVCRLPCGLLIRRPEADAAQTEEARLMAQLLEDTRSRIEASALSDEAKQRLLDQLAALGEKLAGGEITLEDLAAAAAVSDDVKKQMQLLADNTAFLEALSLCGWLAPITEPILGGDPDNVAIAAERQQRALTALADGPKAAACGTIAAAIQSAKAGLPESSRDDVMVALFEQLRLEMRRIELGGFPKADADDLITMAFQKLAFMLEGVMTGTDTGEKIDYTRPDDSKASASASSNVGTGSTGSAAVTGSGDPTAIAGDASSLMQGGIGGASVGADYTISEAEAAVSVYDPTLDKTRRTDQLPEALAAARVPYSRVFGRYYAEVLELLESGRYTTEQQDAISRYFNGL